LARDGVRRDIDTSAKHVDDRSDEFAEIGDSMTANSQEAERVTEP